MPLTRLFPESRREMMKEHMRRFSAGFGLEPLETGDWLSNTRRALAIA